MKYTIILLAALLIFKFSQAQNRDIYADVQGNMVTLWQTAAERNCGALYQMNVELENYQMTWLQQDTGAAAFCICYFDLSVTLGPLSPGTYDVLVYHTEITSPDTLYDGSTSFTIEEGTLRDAVNIISQYQSDCYGGVTVEENYTIADNRVGQNYPNPFDCLTWIPYTLNDTESDQLIIYNAYGQAVNIRNLNAKYGIISWDGKDINGGKLPAGIYYYKLKRQPAGDCRKMVLIRN